ncbi:MAG: glutamate-5-semialdehyde dehydrogenase [Clostridiales bacterium]|nr:glutamate-5-semialdehyde dehydrogenase [Clostridiales bacterium]
MNYLENIGIAAKKASSKLALLLQDEKNTVIKACANSLIKMQDDILKANREDVKLSKENGVKESLIDRLILTPDRIKDMADGLIQIAGLPDPVGEVLSMKLRPNGLTIGEKRVPLGVIGIIYESRPNVTADAFGLCFKTGNAVILRGGSDAINSNKAIIRALHQGLETYGVSKDAVHLIEDTSRELVNSMMKMNEYIDVLIPRGGKGLIDLVKNNSRIPVIETGTGNCHIYVDEYADFDMALDIIDNAKTQRIGVCNTCESLVIHEKISKDFIPLLYKRLDEKGIEIRADERACKICPGCMEATEEDYGREYLDKIISLKIVDSLDDAIDHINKYNTKHSDAIVTKDYSNALRFQNEIDSAAVYVNASTRFTDGNEFGFGAEIGISTQKLHARGPMGLKALTTTKYIIFGDGQIRH